MTDRNRAPWWLWPNLLSLDAPLVALAWFWMFAKAWGVVSLPVSLPVTMALSVWAIYALDRIVDSRKSRPRAALERRHHFHQKYRWFFISAVVGVTIWSSYAALMVLSQTVLMYGVFVAILVACYFAVAVFQKADEHTGLMKNVLAGMTFSYGVAAGVHAYSPVVSFAQMVVSQEVLLFGGLCILNMTAIDFWELDGEDGEDASALIGTGCLLLGGGAMFFSTRSDSFNKPFFYAVLIGAAGIYLLNKYRDRLDQDGRRLWVDLVLLGPVGIYWLWITFYERNLA
ncbi:hypothetical protein N9055_01940 [Akkermansiaceae bacterium]|nr:hypothetical protein [Akkermansiaceae bacterium]MDB4456716.1 hypothetical protein [bacterium]MDA7932001.1 hypothetical protein [Akkermansiaceae bacterium]MDA8875975.1 hypothetical protein [Akkermansiaceae bacterium]MDA8967151.1 hypothetical protein [Akkermansiaceae bacterium]